MIDDCPSPTGPRHHVEPRVGTRVLLQAACPSCRRRRGADPKRRRGARHRSRASSWRGSISSDAWPAEGRRRLPLDGAALLVHAVGAIRAWCRPEPNRYRRRPGFSVESDFRVAESGPGRPDDGTRQAEARESIARARWFPSRHPGRRRRAVLGLRSPVPRNCGLEWLRSVRRR